MNIACYVVTKGEFKSVVIPEQLLSDLCKSLRNNGVETVHFASGSIEVEGVYVPAKGCNNGLLVVPNMEKQEGFNA